MGGSNDDSHILFTEDELRLLEKASSHNKFNSDIDIITTLISILRTRHDRDGGYIQGIRTMMKELGTNIPEGKFFFGRLCHLLGKLAEDDDFKKIITGVRTRVAEFSSRSAPSDKD